MSEEVTGMPEVSWRRSSRCAADRPQCVEVRTDLAAVRDSKTGQALELRVQPLVRAVRGVA